MEIDNKIAEEMRKFYLKTVIELAELATVRELKIMLSYLSALQK